MGRRLSPQTKLTRLAIKEAGDNTLSGLVTDRRGRDWFATYYFLVRVELLDGTSLRRSEHPTSVNKLLRQTLAREDWPIRRHERVIDPTVHSEKYRPTLMGQIQGGPASNGFIYWSPRFGDPISDAARAFLGEEPGGWRATGITSPMVFRRERDRMALAVLAPRVINQPLRIEEVAA